MDPIRWIRDDPEGVRAMLAARGFDAPLDRIIELDKRYRELLAEGERLKAERNKVSKGGPPSEETRARMRATGERIAEIDAGIHVRPDVDETLRKKGAIA